MYRLYYHPLVKEKDIPRINPLMAKRIETAIEKRLLSDPISYGDPLKHTLKGYRKLRVGDYRIIYKVTADSIMIFHIGHRKDVYKFIFGRL